MAHFRPVHWQADSRLKADLSFMYPAGEHQLCPSGRPSVRMTPVVRNGVFAGGGLFFAGTSGDKGAALSRRSRRGFENGAVE